MTLSFVNPNFQTVAKVQQGSMVKYKFANLRSLLNEEERQNNGRCQYREILMSRTAKPQAQYCDITHYPKRYQDPKTGLNYYDSHVYQYIKGLSKGQVLQLQELHRFIDTDSFL